MVKITCISVQYKTRFLETLHNQANTVVSVSSFPPLFDVLLCNGPSLQLTVTWYKIHHAGTQATHWDIQNKATSSSQI